MNHAKSNNNANIPFFINFISEQRFGLLKGVTVRYCKGWFSELGLDFWIISKDIMNKVVSTDIRPVIKGDHNAISLKLRINNLIKGLGYWKINTSLFCEEFFFLEWYQKHYQKYIDNLEESNIMKLENLKIKC